jgi:sulfoxide reductase heme-binding subunit YedZ
MIGRRLGKRIATLVAAAVLTILLLEITEALVPYRRDSIHVVSLVTAYASLVALCGTLLIGPWKVITSRPNPASTDFRRDLGIWAGLMALSHVWFGLHVHFRGKMINYFVDNNARGALRLDFFGLTNYLGSLAILFTAILLMTSNDISLRLLGTRRWKSLHRLNYLILAMVALHAWIFQAVEHRAKITIMMVVSMLYAVAMAQWWGFRHRRALDGARPAPADPQVLPRSPSVRV